MAYYNDSDSVTNVSITFERRQTIVTGRTTYDCVQCYFGSTLAGYQTPNDGRVRFTFGPMDGLEPFFLLAVDTADAETNYFEDASPWDSDNGNRITIRTPTKSDYTPQDKWRVYLGEAGAESADVLVLEQPVFDGGKFSGGWGTEWGEDWAYGDYGPGWGYSWGLGEWGYDCFMLTYVSEALPPGVYPVAVSLVDEVGNESALQETTVTVASWPDAPEDLVIENYDSETDALEISFTASEDIS